MKSLMLLLVLAGANVKEYDAYDPIVITLSKDAVPEGYKRVIFWNVADENLSYHQVGRETLHCWAPPGEYILFANVLLTNFDTQDQIPKTTKIQFKVKSPEPAPPGPTPTPTPTPNPNPNPTIPPDRFDNIGRLVATTSKGLTLREKAGVREVYSTAAARLNSGDANISWSLPEAEEYIKEEKKRFPAGWTSVGQSILPVYKKFLTKNSTKFDYADFFNAVSAGLK